MTQAGWNNVWASELILFSILEYASDHLDDSINIPVDDLRDRIGELDQQKDTVVYCAVGLRGYIASRILKQHGFPVQNLTGGLTSARRLLWAQ